MKYKLTDETLVINGRTLHRIEALRDIPGLVKAGEKGGFVESDMNLSQEGNGWIYPNACVSGDTLIVGDTYIFGLADFYAATADPKKK